MKATLFLMFFLVFAFFSQAQLYKLSESELTFYSEAVVEDITATNTDAVGIWNTANGQIALSIPMNKFMFEKSLMQEHFNEKYLETEKYPKAYFKAIIEGFDANKTSQKLKSTGKITIHGVEVKYSNEGVVEKTESGFHVQSTFMIKLEDHKIKIPRLMWQNIAEEVEISVSLHFQPNE